MLRRASRPLIFCLVFLLVTWGTCPCVYAKMLGLSEALETGAEAEPAAPCWAQPPAPEAPDGTTPSKAPGEDCPCCKSGGWIRDLPPQAQSIQLEQPAPAFLDLPQLDLCAAQIEPERMELGFVTTAPPDDQRPHAAPVGIVRLQT